MHIETRKQKHNLNTEMDLLMIAFPTTKLIGLFLNIIENIFLLFHLIDLF